MLRRSCFVGFTVAALLMAGHGMAPVLSASMQKPIKHTTVYSDGGTPPTSMRVLWDRSDAVVRARIENMAPADQYYSSSRYVITAFGFRVAEVFKADSRLAAPGATFDVRRSGGDRDMGDYILAVDESEFPRFTMGSEYILFLRHEGSASSYFLEGADAAFAIDAEVVRSWGRAPAIKAHDGMRLETFTTLLKSLR